MSEIALVFARARGTDGHLVFGGDANTPPTPGVHLVFRDERVSHGDLVFGADAVDETSVTPITLAARLPALTCRASAIPTAELRIAAVLGGPTLAASLVPSARVTVAASLPALVLSALPRYDARVARPTVARRTHRSEVATPAPFGRAAPFKRSGRRPAGGRESWQFAMDLKAGVRSRIPDAFDPLPSVLRATHENALRLATVARTARFTGLDARHQALRTAFENAVTTAAERRLFDLWQLHRRRSAVTSAWQPGAPLRACWQATAGAGVDLRVGWQVAWQNAMRPPTGRWSPAAPPPPTTDRCYTPSPHLVFAILRTLDADLVFACDGAATPPASGFTVPILRVYFVSNAVDVVRLPDRTPVPVYALQIDLDTDSWAWAFSANLPYAALELIEPSASGPVALEITVNGLVWVMLVEAFELRREFGQSALAVRGRSQAALLVEPYAPTRSFVSPELRTARQLAEAELVRGGLVTGFTLDWQLPDWLVPAGCFTYERASPMSAIGQIVGAVGGYVNADPAEPALIAKSRYPELPWQWSAVTPDRLLPIDVVKTLNLRWQEKPPFNAVYVSGEREGVTGHVVRTGSAGEAVAPMVVNSLITHADAARERGRTILADTGRQAIVTLELPMLEAIGRLDPGLVIAVGEGGDTWRGLVRATRISATWRESLTVRQTIEVERHYL